VREDEDMDGDSTNDDDDAKDLEEEEDQQVIGDDLKEPSKARDEPRRSLDLFFMLPKHILWPQRAFGPTSMERAAMQLFLHHRPINGVPIEFL
jgi:hypothetical protein